MNVSRWFRAAWGTVQTLQDRVAHSTSSYSGTAFGSGLGYGFHQDCLSIEVSVSYRAVKNLVPTEHRDVQERLNVCHEAVVLETAWPVIRLNPGELWKWTFSTRH